MGNAIVILLHDLGGLLRDSRNRLWPPVCSWTTAMHDEHSEDSSGDNLVVRTWTSKKKQSSELDSGPGWETLATLLSLHEDIDRAYSMLLFAAERYFATKRQELISCEAFVELVEALPQVFLAGPSRLFWADSGFSYLHY
eukprot:1455888-Amphidinium_carterae.2